ncbi:unnamed protein product [Linum trigynum]|uniref:Uncharacterized protein n=1 Tax=Linum trigynum TaxID=586398 RepID=A0AAV2E7S3_9ROSI
MSQACKMVDNISQRRASLLRSYGFGFMLNLQIHRDDVKRVYGLPRGDNNVNLDIYRRRSRKCWAINLEIDKDGLGWIDVVEECDE